MPNLSELGPVLIKCRVVSAARWQRAVERGADDLAQTLDALAADTPDWWNEADSDENAPPGLTDYQRAMIEFWLEGGELDLPRQLARNQFLLLDKLGQGGQGEVYRAWQINPPRFVAVKILSLESEGRRHRFEQEARAMMKIQHPAVARFYLSERVRDAKGKPTEESLIAMEFVEGNDLWRLIDAIGPMPWRFVVQWAIDLLGGLAVIHHNGFIHRDIKPANVMILGPIPEPGVSPTATSAKLLDFGAVKPASDGGATSRTRTFIGTREYAPPEQWEEQTVPASDIYALGATLFQALTGRPPYEVEGRDAIAFMKAHTRAPIPDVSLLNPTVPEELSFLIRQMLAKDPEDRGSATQLVERFKGLLPTKEAAKPSLAPTRQPVRESQLATRDQPRLAAVPETESKGLVHALVHPLFSVLERIFVPGDLRPPTGHEPPLPERIATLLRRPLVLITIAVLVGLIVLWVLR